MADPRRYIGVRISEQGHRYIQLVADRDKTNYSAALRHLLALGVRSDMEAHDDSRLPTNSAERSANPGHVRPDDDQRGDRHGDPGSNAVSLVPDHPGPDTVSVGDAIGHLYRAGLNPSQASEDDNSAA